MGRLNAVTASEDRSGVVDHVVRLARAQDAKDWPAVAASYTPDAVYVHPAGRLEGADAIVTRTRAALERLDASQHLLGSHLVEVDGDVARSSCYFHAQHVREGAVGGDHYVIAGDYTDTLVRTPDGWRIAERVQTYLWRSGNRDVVAR